VTARRYQSYRHALNLLSTIEPGRAFSADRDLIADLAEEMLLTRADQPVGQRARRATDCLARLVETGGLERPVAERLWQAIWAAGPGGEEQAPEDQRLAAGPR
jgi:hypothetical protein